MLFRTKICVKIKCSTALKSCMRKISYILIFKNENIVDESEYEEKILRDEFRLDEGVNPSVYLQRM